MDPAPGHELEHLADWLHRGGGQVRTRRVGDWWRLGHDADALLEGNRFALEGIAADYGAANLTRTTVQGAVVAHPSAVLESSVVRGPAIIGPGARITHSYVGPYTSIGRDVVIEGSELEHSIVFPGARIQHLSTRLEASVVGAGARVFAGVPPAAGPARDGGRRSRGLARLRYSRPGWSTGESRDLRTRRDPPPKN